MLDVQWLSQLFLGAVFICSGMGKIVYWSRFRDTFSAMEILSRRVAGIVAFALPPVEVGTGTCDFRRLASSSVWPIDAVANLYISARSYFISVARTQGIGLWLFRGFRAEEVNGEFDFSKCFVVSDWSPSFVSTRSAGPQSSGTIYGLPLSFGSPDGLGHAEQYSEHSRNASFRQLRTILEDIRCRGQPSAYSHISPYGF